MIIDIDYHLKKYDISVNGIVQVGAHRGGEVELFKKISNNKIYLFEPQKSLYKFLKDKFVDDSNIIIYNVALGEKQSQLNMYKDQNNDSQSSSLMKPKEHLKYHSYIEFKYDPDEIVNVKVLDSYKIKNVNLICIDVQGYELNVLKGANSFLKQCEAVLIEINRKELYVGCPKVQDIDNFLKSYGFIRVVTKWWKKTIPWGDALYVKKEKINSLVFLKLSILNFLNTKAFTYFILGKILTFKYLITRK